MRTETAAVEERPSMTPASTSQAQERPSVSEVEECRGDARMPGRGQPDVVVVAASQTEEARERRRALGKPSRPNGSHISSS